MTEESDEKLAEAIQQGDLERFGILIDRYEAKLKRYARKFLYNSDDIEDQVQETFIKAYTHIQSFDTTRKFSPWIYRIAHNIFVNELRRQTYAPINFFDPDTIFPYLTAKETTDKATLDAELSKIIDEVIDILPVKYKEPLILYFYEEQSYEDISEILRIPISTVGVRIKRAKDKLKQAYEDKINRQNHDKT